MDIESPTKENALRALGNNEIRTLDSGEFEAVFVDDNGVEHIQTYATREDAESALKEKTVGQEQ